MPVFKWENFVNDVVKTTLNPFEGEEGTILYGLPGWKLSHTKKKKEREKRKEKRRKEKGRSVTFSTNLPLCPPDCFKKKV